MPDRLILEGTVSDFLILEGTSSDVLLLEGGVVRAPDGSLGISMTGLQGPSGISSPISDNTGINTVLNN